MSLVNTRFLVVAMVFVYGCTTGRQVAETPSPFELAAHSWIGGSIDAMTAVWGEPTRVSNVQAEDGPGIAHWRSGGRGTFGAPPSSGGRCAVDAYFHEDRIIHRVEVTGRRCDERYAEHLDSLTR